MPKMKTHSGSKKRFNLTASGKVKRAHEGHNHILTKKDRKRKNRLQEMTYVSSAQEGTVKNRLIPYKK